MKIKFLHVSINNFELPQEKLPDNAKILKSLTEDELSKKSLLFFFPITLWMILFEILRRFVFHRTPFPMTGNGALFSMTLFPVLIMILGLPFHELLHAVIYPKTSTAYIFNLKETGGLCVVSSGKIKRSRYIFMTLFPAIILGFVPQIILLFYTGQSHSFINILFMTSYLFLLIACGDFYNLFFILKHVPKKSYIVNSGKDTYYY